MCKKLKVLIVDDDDDSKLLTSIRIKEYAKKIFKANDGFDAIQIFSNNQDIDLIFMDIQMPIMNGYEATEQIRKLSKKVIIIVQTASTTDKNLAIECGANDCISKPSNIVFIKSLINKYFTY